MKYLMMLMLVGCYHNSIDMQIESAEKENARQNAEVKRLTQEAEQLGWEIREDQKKDAGMMVYIPGVSNEGQIEIPISEWPEQDIK